MERRMVNVRIESTILGHVLKGHKMERIETDWPDDAVVLNAFWDGARGQAVLTVWSATFDIVPENYMLPEWAPTITVQSDIVSELMNRLRDEEIGS